MKFLPKSGAVHRTIVITLLAFAWAGVGSLTYTAHVTGKRAAETIDIRINQLLDTVQSTVKTACFLHDADLAQEVARGLLSNSEVLRVTITADGRMLADEARRNEATADAATVLERQVTSPFQAHRVIGAVQLTPNPDVVAHLRQQDVLLAVQQLAWQLLFVSVAIVAALIVFLVRPITRLSAELHRMDPVAGDRLTIPPGHADTEIGRLVTDINRLSEHLVTALEEARQARSVAESASNAKSTFLANMSHEIRTPLGAVIGLARIGIRDAANQACAPTFRHIHDASIHLLDVINDILDFSKIEAGKLAIETQPARLTDIGAEALELVRPRAAEKGLTLSYWPSPSLPEWVDGDPMRIRQILVNLLSNAIKFTERGAVRLTLLREGDEIWFAVKDEGIGMSADEVGRLFRPFEQADGSTTRKYGGTGLGLAISMNLASLMGGDIHVVSSPGGGSTFTLQLPLRETAAPARAPAAAVMTASHTASQLAGYRILAAEDVEVNRLVLEDLLLEQGARCSFATNGREAVALVATNPQAFDVVLMDVQMPEMDGYAATTRIHEIRADLPVIGLTAHAFAEQREHCLAAGMVDHVSKPVDPPALIAAIRRWALAGDAAAPAAAPDGACSFRTGSIDWDALDRRFKGRPAFVRQIAQTVISGHAKTPARLRALAAEGNFGELGQLAHALKGIAGNLAAQSQQGLAAALEAAAGRQEAAARELAGQLAEQFEILLGELERFVAAG